MADLTSRATVVDYSKWDLIEDSDDERRTAKEKEEKAAAQHRKELAAKAPKPPKVDWSKVNLEDPSTLGPRPPPDRASSPATHRARARVRGTRCQLTHGGCVGNDGRASTTAKRRWG
jgi:hypothetical protein